LSPRPHRGRAPKTEHTKTPREENHRRISLVEKQPRHAEVKRVKDKLGNSARNPFDRSERGNKGIRKDIPCKGERLVGSLDDKASGPMGTVCLDGELVEGRPGIRN